MFFLQLLQQRWRKLISKQRKGLSDNRGSGRKILIAVEISDVSSPKFQTERGGWKNFEMDIFMKMPRHLVIELDSA